VRIGVGGLSAVLAAGILLLAGCGSASEGAGEQPGDPAITDVVITDRTDLVFGETGVWEGIQVTVSAPTDDPEADTALEDERVVYCSVSMFNTSNQPLEYDGLEFILFDSEDQLYEDFGEPSVPALGVGILEPGDTATGAVAYNVPLQGSFDRVAWQRNFLADPELTWSVR
jgi:hypothetical protein